MLSERHKVVKAVTYNNMGCYYRKRGKLRTAQSFVQKALDIESKLPSATRTADTHINMCTIMSELKRHDQAIKHAHTALKLLLTEIFGPDGYAQGADGEGDEGPQIPPDRVAVLAIAYHNLAVQQEFLAMWTQALGTTRLPNTTQHQDGITQHPLTSSGSYEKSYKVVTTHLGEDNPLVKSLYESYNEAKHKAEEYNDKQMAQAKRAAKFGALRGQQPKGGGTATHALTHRELLMLSSHEEDEH